jgi:hypothetical protein
VIEGTQTGLVGGALSAGQAAPAVLATLRVDDELCYLAGRLGGSGAVPAGSLLRV